VSRCEGSISSTGFRGRFPENSLPVLQRLIYLLYIAPFASLAEVGPLMKVMDQNELMVAELKELRRQHRALDEEIAALGETALGDQLRIKRLKKRKLQLKDEITRVEDKLYPDIIA
jgi:hypothetical protein